MPPTRPNPNGALPNHLFNTYLHSLTLTNPNLTLDATNKTLSVRPAPNQTRTVAVISGSALRFTPYIASFVGSGLLTACIGSDSPAPPDPVEHVRVAIQERVLTVKKVLFIVPQYGDDEEIVAGAALSAKHHDPMLQFEYLTAPGTLQLGPGPELPQRPGAGLPLLLKICSAVAAKGYPLEEVVHVGKLVVKNLLSVGSNLRPDLQDGANSGHSEPDLSSQVRQMVSQMLDPNLRNAGFVEVNSNEVVLLISGHSGLTMLEMGAVTSEVVKQMEYWHIRPVRIYTESVSVLSVLGQEGIRNRDFAITILNVCNTDIGGPSMIQLLDAPAEAAGWTAFAKSWEVKNTWLWERNAQWARPSGLRCNSQGIWRAAMNGSRAVVAFAKRNKLVGGYPHESWYGDAAASAAQNSHAQDIWKSAKGAIEALASLPALSSDLVYVMNDMLSATAPALDNPFGALVTIFFTGLTQSFRNQSETAVEVNIGLWVYALEDAFQELLQYANHRPAMASMLCALEAFVQTLHRTGDLSKAARAAEQSPDTATDLSAQLLCAFFAGLVGPVNGKLEQGLDVDNKAERGEEQKGHPGPDTEASAEKGLQAEVLDHSLREEGLTVQMSETQEQSKTSAEQTEIEAATTCLESLVPTTESAAGHSSATAPRDAPLGLISTETSSNQDVQPRTIDEAQVTPGQIAHPSQDDIVDVRQVRRSQFDTAMGDIPGRQRVPLPTRQIETTSLLDLVRQQMEALAVATNLEDAPEQDPDEEEYEFV